MLLSQSGKGSTSTYSYICSRRNNTIIASYSIFESPSLTLLKMAYHPLHFCQPQRLYNVFLFAPTFASVLERSAYSWGLMCEMSKHTSSCTFDTLHVRLISKLAGPHLFSLIGIGFAHANSCFLWLQWIVTIIKKLNCSRSGMNAYYMH